MELITNIENNKYDLQLGDIIVIDFDFIGKQSYLITGTDEFFMAVNLNGESSLNGKHESLEMLIELIYKIHDSSDVEILPSKDYILKLERRDT